MIQNVAHDDYGSIYANFPTFFNPKAQLIVSVVNDQPKITFYGAENGDAMGADLDLNQEFTPKASILITALITAVSGNTVINPISFIRKNSLERYFTIYKR